MKKITRNILLLLLVLPLIMIIINSFFLNNEWPKLNFTIIRFDALNYWLDYNMYSSLTYSIILSLVVASLSLIICFYSAKALTYYNFKLKSSFRLLFLLPFIIPVTSVSLGIYYQFLVLGLSGNSLGIVFIHLLCTCPYVIIILESSMAKNNLKKEFIAKQLKASSFKTLIYISIPENIKAIYTSFFLAYTISFSQYFTTFLIGQPNIKTYAMELYPFLIENNIHYSSFFNLIFIISIILVLSVLFYTTKTIFKNKLNYHFKGDKHD